MKSAIVFCSVLLGVHLLVMAQYDEVNEETKMLMPSFTAFNSPPNVPFDPSSGILELGINPIGEDSATTPAAESLMGTRCECGLFESTSVADHDIPIINHSPMSVSCDHIGQDMCLQMCSSIAQEAEDYGPQVLCASLGHYNQLMVFIHYRICGATNWSYTGVSSTNGFCCHDHQVVECGPAGNHIN